MGWAHNIVQLIRRTVHAILAQDVNTHLPCEVVEYDENTNLVKLKPCINRIRVNDPDNLGTVQWPVIEDVPVRQYGSGKCLLTIAPQAGSYGYYHVSQRALDSWLTKGGIVDPSSSRKFDISDGVFEPGLYPLIPDGDNGLIVPAINTDRIELRTRVGTCYVAVLDDETVEIDAPVTVKVGGAAATEPAMQGSKFITKYNAHTHSTAFGPSGAPIVPWVPADNSTKVKIG